MLRFLSKRNRSRKAILIGFILLLAIGLIGFFGPNWSGLQGATAEDAAVAEVGGYEVTVKELRQALASRGQQISQGRGAAGAEDPATIFELMGPQVIDDLVRQKLILFEADQHHLQPTDQEVQERIKQMFTPWPGAEAYRRQLQQAGMTTVQFEDNIRALVAEEKLRSFVTLPAQVSEQEIEEEYRRNGTNYTVRWVEVDPEKLKDKVQFSDSDLRAYFEQRKGEFRITGEQRRARYILINEKAAGETIQVPDDELRRNFNPELNIKQVRVSQIVLNIPKQKTETSADKAGAATSTLTEDDIRKKADDIVARAKGLEGKAAEDFAALARLASEDAKSKPGGGDIGWVNKSDKRETDDPLNRVFSMQKGEVSQPIKKGDKFYILKVTDRKLPTFEESRAQLLKEARATKGYSKTIEIATEAEQKYKESKNAEAVVAEINKKYGAQVSSVKETPFFVEGDKLPDIGEATEFQEAIFELQNVNEIADRVNVTSGMAIGQYLEKRDPHDPTFEEVKSKVEDRYRVDKSKELTLERAKQLAASANPDALDSAAKAMGLKADERSGLTADASIGPLVGESTKGRAFKTEPGHVLNEPIKADNSESYVVVAVLKRTDADMGEAFEKQRKQIEERLLDAKRNILFSAYVSSVQKRLKAAGKIKIYQDVAQEAIAKGGGVTPSGVPRSGSFPASGPRRPRRTPPAPVLPPQ